MQKQKSKKPRENQKKQKNQKKQYSRTLAKVKMQKSKKPRENQKKQKKQKKTIFQDSCLLTLSPDFWNIVFFVFFGFLEVFWIFAFLLLQESWNLVRAPQRALIPPYHGGGRARRSVLLVKSVSILSVTSLSVTKLSVTSLTVTILSVTSLSVTNLWVFKFLLGQTWNGQLSP